MTRKNDDFGFIPDKDSAQQPANDFGFKQQGLLSQIGDLLKGQVEGVKAIPGIVGRTSQEFGEHPMQSLSNIASGGLQAAGGMAKNIAESPFDLMKSIYQHLPGETAQKLAQSTPQPFRDVQTEFMSPEQAATGSAQFGGLAGPLALGGGAFKGLSSLAALGGASPLAAGSLAIPALGSVASPPGERTAGALVAGGEAALGKGLTKIPKTPKLAKGISEEALAKYLKNKEGARPYNQINDAIKSIPEGVDLPLHDIVQSPKMANAYQKARLVMGSGADEPYENLEVALRKKLADTGLQDIGDASGIHQQSFDAMVPKYKRIKGASDEAYKALDDSADANNLEYKPKSAINTIDSVVSDRLGGKKFDPNLELHKPYAEVVGQLDQIKNELSPKTSSTITGIKKSPTSFNDARKMVTRVNRLIQSNASPDKKHIQSMLLNAKTGIEKSLEESAASHPELYEMHKSAKAARVKQGKMEFKDINRKQMTPFYKALRDGFVKGDFVDQHIKSSTGTKDYSSEAKKFMGNIDDERLRSEIGKKILAARMGDKGVNSKLNNLGNLGKDTLKVLAGKDKAKDIQSLVDFNKHFPSHTRAVFDPPTGASGSKASQLVALIQGALAMPSAGLSLAAPMGVARAFQRTMRHPKALEKYLQVHKPRGKKGSSSKEKVTQLPDLDVRYEDMNQGAQ